MSITFNNSNNEMKKVLKQTSTPVSILGEQHSLDDEAPCRTVPVFIVNSSILFKPTPESPPAN